MSQQELLKTVSAVLDGIGRPWFLTGSMASSLQGEPRATHDSDLVVWLTASDVTSLCDAFPWPRFLLEREAASQAVLHRSMVSLLELETGLKVDFWIVPDEPFDRSRMERRQRVRVADFDLWVSSPEDTLVAKLRWAALAGGSEKQFRDALRIYEVQGSALDQGYLDRWAEALGLMEAMARIRREAAPASPS